MAKNQPTGTYDPATGIFTPAKKKGRGCLWLVLVPVILIFVIVAAFGGQTDTGPADDSAETDAPETEASETEPETEETAEPETEAPAPETKAQETDPPETEAPAPSVTPEPEPEPDPEPEPEPGSPEWNRAFIDAHQYEIIAAAKQTMDASGEEFSFPSLAPQKWTVVMFDDSAVTASTDIVFRGTSVAFLYVATPQFDASGKFTGTTNHYVEAGGIILYTDGYCNDVFDTIRGWFGNPEKIDGAYVKEGYDPDGSYMAAMVEGETIEIYWMADRGQTMALYWAGSFTQPSGDAEYTFDSVNDTAKTASAILASNDPTKPIRVKNGTISFSVTVQGVTNTVRMVPWGGGIS